MNQLQIGMTVLIETKRRVFLALTDVLKAMWKQKKTAQPANLTEGLVQRKSYATKVAIRLKTRVMMSKSATSPAVTKICAMEPRYQWPVVSYSWHALLQFLSVNFFVKRIVTSSVKA